MTNAELELTAKIVQAVQARQIYLENETATDYGNDNAARNGALAELKHIQTYLQTLARDPLPYPYGEWIEG